jgi:DNA-directed RNA polymerase alpha subunit
MTPFHCPHCGKLIGFAIADPTPHKTSGAHAALKLLNSPIDEIDWTECQQHVRIRHMFEIENIKTLRELVSHTEEEMLRCPNFGKTSLEQIKRVLTPLGLKFGMDGI